MASPNSVVNNIALGSLITGNISSVNPIQSYSFNAPSNSIYDLSFVAPSSNLTDSNNIQSNNATYNISLTNQSGQTVGSFTTNQLNTSPTLFYNLTPGSYSVQITQPTGVNTDSYKFNISAINLNNNGITNIQLPSGPNTKPLVSLKGSIQSSTTTQIYSIDLNAGDLCTFTCASDSTSSLGGLKGGKLSLLNSIGNPLENNTATLFLQQVGLSEQYVNSDPSIEIVAPYTGTYYLTVDSPASVGAYTLLTEKLDAPELLKGVANQMGANPNDGYWASSKGKTLNLTYGFMTTEIIPNTPSGFDASKPSSTASSGFAVMTADQQKAVVQALNIVSSLCNIQFTLNTNQTTANILFGTNSQTSSTGTTYTVSKNNDGSFKQTSVFISNFFSSVINTLDQPGGFGFNTLLHEIAHALGLKHPGAYDSASLPQSSTTYTYYLPKGWDNTQFSIMSYVFQQTQSPFSASYATLDIVALQSLYGPPTNSTIVSFKVSPTAPTYTTAPIGSLGSTIDLSNQTQGSSVSLLAGTYSSIGKNADGTPIHNNIVIPLSSQYTNVVGSNTGGDVIYCNSLNNIISLNGPNCVVFGNTNGISQVKIKSDFANFKLSSNKNTLTLTDNTNKLGTETLIDVARVNFNNTLSIAFDLGVKQSAGQTAEILGAAFGSTFLSNKQYVAIGLNLFDSGQTMTQVAQAAINTGKVSAPDNTSFVKAVWGNVMGSTIDPVNLSTFVGALNNGTYTQASLLALAAGTITNQANINLVGLVQTGIQYA
jgi:serralysin